MKALIAIKSFNPGQDVLKDIDWQKNRLLDAGYDVEICADNGPDASRLAEKLKRIECIAGSMVMLNLTEEWDRGCSLFAGAACKKVLRFFGEYSTPAVVAAKAGADIVYCDSAHSFEACASAGVERSRLFLLPINYNADYYDGIKPEMRFLHRLIDGKINVIIEATGTGHDSEELALNAARKYTKYFEKSLRLIIIENPPFEGSATGSRKEELDVYDLSGKAARVFRPNLSRRKALFLAAHSILVPSACRGMTGRTLEAQYFKVPVLTFGKGGAGTSGVYDCGDCPTEELAAAIYTFYHNLDARIDLTGRGSEEYTKYVTARREELFLGPLKGLK